MKTVLQFCFFFSGDLQLYRNEKALMDAISEGDAKLLDMLIKQTPSININTCKYQMHSPLIAVISYGHLDCVNVLIQHHVNVNQIPMDDQWTPLMHAAHHNQDKIMLSLLEAGAMVDEGNYM